NCPSCGRPYELPDALARLPLVCKQCGQRITPPAPTPSAPPPPPPSAPPGATPPPPAPVIPVTAPPKPTPVPPPPAPAPKPPPPPPVPVPVVPKLPTDERTKEGVLVSKTDSPPDNDFNAGGSTAAGPGESNRTHPVALSESKRPHPAELNGAPSEHEELIADI